MEDFKMKVLSLFDGMSCGQVALNRLGIDVEKYYASEIDKYAIQVTQDKFPNTVQLGDVQFITKYTFGSNKIDLLIGGSPCQGFSFAGKQLNFNDHRSVLFFEFVRLIKELKPKYFLLENVLMKQEYQDVISKYLGCKPIRIDSALVSAQTRKRLYWTNIPNVTQPEDKGIVLRDILEYGMAGEDAVKHTDRNRRHLKSVDGKSLCATATMYKGAGNNGTTLIQVDDKLRHQEATKKGYAEASVGEGLDLTFPESKTRRGRAMKYKSNCLTAASHEMGVVIDSSKPNQINPDKSAKSSSEDEKGLQPHMQDRVFHEDGKSHALTSSFASRTKVGKFEESVVVRPAAIVGRRLNERGVREDYNKDVPITQCLQVKHNSDKSGTLTTVEKDNVLSENKPGRYPNAYEDKKLTWRKLTVLECERLQTLPNGYTLVLDEKGNQLVSNSQRYKMIGNGWTIDVITHILKNII